MHLLKLGFEFEVLQMPEVALFGRFDCLFSQLLELGLQIHYNLAVLAWLNGIADHETRSVKLRVIFVMKGRLRTVVGLQQRVVVLYLFVLHHVVLAERGVDEVLARGSQKVEVVDLPIYVILDLILNLLVGASAIWRSLEKRTRGRLIV